MDPSREKFTPPTVGRWLHHVHMCSLPIRNLPSLKSCEFMQRQYAEVSVSCFKRNSIIAFGKCKLLHLMCVGKERGVVSRCGGYSYGLFCATTPLCGHTSKDTILLGEGIKRRGSSRGCDGWPSSDLRNHRMGEYDSLFARLYRTPWLISCWRCNESYWLTLLGVSSYFYFFK